MYRRRILECQLWKSGGSEASISKRVARSCAFSGHYLDERKCIGNAEGKDPVSEAANPPGASVLCHRGGEGKHIAYSFFGLELSNAFFV